MTHASIGITTRRNRAGFDAMERRLDRVDDLAKQFAAGVKKSAQARAPVRTGNLKKSIRYKKQPRKGQSYYQIKVGAKYGVYVEYGTRHMRAQPYFRPAIEEQKRIFRQEFRTVFRK